MKKKNMHDFIYIISGCFFASFGTACFLLPNKLSSGGFAGIATIIYYFFNIPLGKTIFILNIPLFIFGFIKLGKLFIAKSIFSTILYSNFINMFSKYVIFEHDNFLSSIYGGIFIGIGLALIFKANSSTGGTDLIAHIVNKYSSKVKISKILVIVDIIIVIMNLIAFKDVNIGLYSAIAIYISGKMIDIIFEGINFCKVIYIISDYSDIILDKLNYDENLGATAFYGKGSYSKKDKTIVMCVSKRRDVVTIKDIAKEIDSHAFIIITDAVEVYGLGFKS